MTRRHKLLDDFDSHSRLYAGVMINSKPNEETTKNLDTMLADDLNRLSSNERSKIYEEIHGVDSTVNESPEILEQKLNALQDEINKIHHKPAYDQAIAISDDYIGSAKFRLMFLRAECLDPGRAAVRLVKFMENKLKYFGQESLARKIVLSDFDKEDLASLKSGTAQILAERDRAGRLVLGMFKKLVSSSRPYVRVENLMKTLVFLYTTVIENDEETQRQGTILLLYFLGEGRMNCDDDLRQNHAPQTLEWLPIKVKCVHICCDSGLMSSLAPLIVGPLDARNRVRIRMHAGSQTECHYKLMTFGIPVHAIPVTSGTKLKIAGHLKWVAKQQYRDKAISQFGDFEGIDLPGSLDILLGRGKIFQDHSGNQKMRKIVEDHVDDYINAEKSIKTQIAWNLVVQLKESASRFLARSNDGWWFEVTDELAREKVSVCFRTFLSHNPEARKQDTQSVETSDGNKRTKISQED
eukprot:scaffold839_cov138-Cylindrotheca_fusiformis.AAC.3